MTGTCMNCGRDAEATASNEGYSDCCNDRIAYGDEARGIKQEIAAEAEVERDKEQAGRAD